MYTIYNVSYEDLLIESVLWWSNYITFADFELGGFHRVSFIIVKTNELCLRKKSITTATIINLFITSVNIILYSVQGSFSKSVYCTGVLCLGDIFKMYIHKREKFFLSNLLTHLISELIHTSNVWKSRVYSVTTVLWRLSVF